MHLKKIIHEVRPNIIFLCETRLVVHKMQYKCSCLGFDNCLVVDRHGRGGDLALLWKLEVNVSVY